MSDLDIRILGLPFSKGSIMNFDCFKIGMLGFGDLGTRQIEFLNFITVLLKKDFLIIKILRT
jgi:hypothetical protein